MKIISTEQKLTTTELYLVDFINNNPDYFIEQPSGEIAKKANVSPSAITRFAKKLGFGNLKGLQIMVGQKSLELEKIDLLDNEEAVTNNLKNLELEPNFSMNQFLEQIDPLILRNIINKIIRAKNVYVFQNNTNSTIVTTLTFVLQRLGIEVITNNGFVSQLFHLAKLNKSDLVIIFASNFYDSDLLYLTEQILEYNLPLAVISGNEKHKQMNNDSKNITWLRLPKSSEEESLNELNYQIFSLMICKVIYKKLYKIIDKEKNTILKNEKILNQWNTYFKRNNRWQK